jgi:hypothetical protein
MAGRRLSIIDLIDKITNYAYAFQCNPDKFKNAVDYSVTFSFEWVFMIM